MLYFSNMLQIIVLANNLNEFIHFKVGMFPVFSLNVFFWTLQEKHIMSERNVLLKNVKHPFLVGLHYSFQTADKLYFVLDYINGGEVRLSQFFL